MIKPDLTYLYKTISYISVSCTLLFTVGCSRETRTFGEQDVFRYNSYANISSLDPAFARTQSNIWAVNQLFNGLVQLNNALQIEPDIAKSWVLSEDGLRYTFTLRDDVYFHKNAVFGADSTRTVKASDFVYSLNRLVDPKVAAPGKWVMNYTDRFYAENDSTLIIKLKQPFPAFLGLLTTKYCSVVPFEAVDHYRDNFRSNPVGTGPFRFKLWEENTKLVFRKNPAYYEKDASGAALPYLEAVAITFLPDKQSAFLQFIQGNIDFISGLDPSYKDEILTVSGELQEAYKDHITLLKGPYLNTEYLGFYMGSSSTDIQSVLLRKAINLGFDRIKMITYLRNGIGTPAVNGFIPKGLPSFNAQQGYTYQPDKARSLIARYKKESGNINPKITITTDSNYLDLCEYIQRELQKLGLAIQVEVIPASTLRQSKATGKLDCFRASWIADYPDAENYLSLFYSMNFAPDGPNYTHYKNNVFDSLYERATSEVDLRKRYLLYQKMDSLLIQDAPVVPLYYDQALRFTHKNITGLGTNPINLLTLKRVRKK